VRKPKLRFDFHDFGITEGAIFDYIYTDPYPLGLNRSAPREFISGVLSAALTYKLGNKSIDHTRRRYLDSFEPEKKPYIREQIELFLTYMDNFINDFRKGHRDDSIGNEHTGLVLFDVYCFRALDSIKAAAILSTHGFFGETMSVLRYFVEQISWLTVAISMKDGDEIRRIKAEASLTAAKRIFPQIGDLYGFLSETTHFRPDHHGLHLSIDDGRVATLLRSARFSAFGYCATVICSAYLVDLILGAINCQYPYEKTKFQSQIVELYEMIKAYFQSGGNSAFIARILSAAAPIDINFAPWPSPIFKPQGT
jgi:hypothetical protein